MPSQSLTGGPDRAGVRSSFPWSGTVNTDCDGYAGDSIGAAAQVFATGEPSIAIAGGSAVHVMGPADQLDGFGYRAGDTTPKLWRPVKLVTAFDGHDPINPFDPVGVVPPLEPSTYWVPDELVSIDGDKVGDVSVDVVAGTVVQTPDGTFTGGATLTAAAKPFDW